MSVSGPVAAGAAVPVGVVAGKRVGRAAGHLGARVYDRTRRRAMNFFDVQYLTNTILPLVQTKCNVELAPASFQQTSAFLQKRAAEHDRGNNAQVEDGEDEGFLEFEKETISLLENSKELEATADKVEE
eukprot:g4801.t1